MCFLIAEGINASCDFAIQDTGNVWFMTPQNLMAKAARILKEYEVPCDVH